jgi:phosphoribosylformylglycinamidine synthase
MVRINTVVLPGSDASVIRVPGSEKKGIALSSDCNPLHCWLDPREGGKAAVAEAARNVVCAGARPLAITNCLNFGNPERPDIMWQFVEAVEGLGEACRALGTPVTGGNVSFYNETLGTGVMPTPTVGMVGLLDDVFRHMTQWFRNEGDLVLLLGENREELGGTEYLRVVHGLKKGLPPRIDLEFEKRIQEFTMAVIGAGLVSSAHDCSEGGLAVALAESCLSGPDAPLGARVELRDDVRPDALLFGETQSRIVFSVPAETLEDMQARASVQSLPLAVIGTVGGGSLRVTAGSARIDIDLDAMNAAWRESFAANFRK